MNLALHLLVEGRVHVPFVQKEVDPLCYQLLELDLVLDLIQNQIEINSFELLEAFVTRRDVLLDGAERCFKHAKRAYKLQISNELLSFLQLLKILNWLAALRTLVVFNVELFLNALSAKLAATGRLISLRHQEATLLTPILVK